jgi:S-adenosylmethionine/arginine decarboxylase-like enzyme
MTAVDEYPEPDLADVDIAQCAERYWWHLEAAQLAFHGVPEESRWG